MKLHQFPECNAVIGVGQDEYQPLPAHLDYKNDETGKVTFCWRLTWRERLRVLWTGELWHEVLTFRKPFQPQKLSVEKPIIYEDHATTAVTPPVTA